MQKGTIQEDHIPVNKFELWVVGMPPLTVIAITGLEEELDTVDFPDRTTASGGRTAPVEFVMTMPAHHAVEQAAMEIWFQESQDPVLPTYKKPATLIVSRLSGGAGKTITFPDLFTKKRGISDLDADNEGDMTTVEWTMRASDALPI